MAPHLAVLRRRLAPLARYGIQVRVRLERRRRSYAFLYAV